MSASLAGARRQARQGSSILTSKTDRARAAIRAAVEPLEGRMLLSVSDILGLAGGGHDADDPSADLVDAVVASKSHVRQAPAVAAPVAGAAVRVSSRGAHGHAPPARPKLPDQADPLSPVGDPMAVAKADKAGTGATGGPVMTTLDNQGWAISASVQAQSNASEELDAPPGYFRFYASVGGCGAGSDPPSAVTIAYNLGGTATAREDYDGPLLNQSVNVPLCGADGFIDVPFSAIDDELDEPDETVEVHLTGACAAGATSFSFVTADALANVASGDFTPVTKVGQVGADGVYKTNEATSGTVYASGVDGPRDLDLIVNLTRFKKPQQGVVVTITRQDAAANTDAKVWSGDANADGFAVGVRTLRDSCQHTTNQNGEVKFRITGVDAPGANGGRVTFNITWTNADKRPQGKTFSVLVKP
jgi:hypothetical protein